MPSTTPRDGSRLDAFFDRLGLGMRGKLITLFVVIKVLPLALLGWLAWVASGQLASQLESDAQAITSVADDSVAAIGELAASDSVKALDDRARDEIERITTDTARAVAAFLYARDDDIRYAASLEPSVDGFQRFLGNRLGRLTDPGAWALSEDGTHWQAVGKTDEATPVTLSLKENTREFHYRPPETTSPSLTRPLYLEMSYIGLDGRERVKVVTGKRTSPQLHDVSKPENTFVRAEHYFAQLKRLKPGEIYVSPVVGAYVGSPIIGAYTPEAAKKAGIPYAPESAAFAGRENPLGQRFQGLVRWATPVVRNGAITGWVTLALDHDHLMAFTDNLMPTSARYTALPDASEGNYAFMWDPFGRNIAHPRHYFIVGYDPKSGEPVEPWLTDEAYTAWKASGQPYAVFAATLPEYDGQSHQRRPSRAQIATGHIGLDCRYLDFAPQCTGWQQLVQHGGSGSFVILWSGIWKLTTAAAIPYYTGQYGDSPRGFGFVTIGANVDEFHRPANETRQRIQDRVAQVDREIASLAKQARENIRDSLARSSWSLIGSTMAMSVLVVLIAIWMASYLTGRIRVLLAGIARFRAGERRFRFHSARRDEMGSLASALDSMADAMEDNLHRLESEVVEHRRTGNELHAIKAQLEQRVAERTADLRHANTRLEEEIEVRGQAEERARRLSEEDPLTGLANRRRFMEQLDHAIAVSKRKQRQAALLFMDLDNFKAVNDQYGHAVGDRLLERVAQLLRRCVRASDTIARLGGDEFAILLEEIDGPAGAVNVAEKVLSLFVRGMNFDGHVHGTGTSIGITVLPQDSDDPEQLLLNADLAMYRAKEAGGNRYQFFTTAMQAETTERKALEEQLAVALPRGEFLLHFQPRYDITQGCATELECLLRWHHPEHGLLAPGAFLDVADSIGMLPMIDHWVLNEACRQARRWQDAGVAVGRVAVNVSAQDIANVGFVDGVRAALSASALPASVLELEITERALIGQAEAALTNIAALREAGVSVAIDDFGIEYSSLQRLVDYPIDVLKIDRYFVARIGEPKAEAVIRALHALACSIGMTVVAEGVETTDQRNFLDALGCHLMQGFLFATPLPAADLPAALRLPVPEGVPN